MPTLQDITERRQEVLRTARRHGARNVRLFGSVVRGEAEARSDVDVLVELEEGRSLLDHVALKQDLEDLLGCPVDVVTENALHRLLRERILEEAMPL
ncbi:MAG: nucleotidyltransferase family protein [Candidatus Brocadiia bacterium]